MRLLSENLGLVESGWIWGDPRGERETPMRQAQGGPLTTSGDLLMSLRTRAPALHTKVLQKG
jgi:hypothetical protein